MYVVFNWYGFYVLKMTPLYSYHDCLFS